MKSKAFAAALVLCGVFALGVFAQTPTPTNQPAQWYALRNPKIINWDGEVYTVEHASGVVRIPWAQIPEWIRRQQTPASGSAASPAPTPQMASIPRSPLTTFAGIVLGLLIIGPFVALRIWWHFRVFRPYVDSLEQQQIGNPALRAQQKLYRIYVLVGGIVLLVLWQRYFR